MEWKQKTDRALSWIYPGLKIKRWVLLAIFGFFGAMLGFTLLAGPQLISYIERVVEPLPDYLYSPVYSGTLLAIGLLMMGLGMQRAVAAAKEALSLSKDRHLIDLLFTKRYLQSGPRIVTIGGGTGLSNLLRELKEYTSNLTAVVTVTDDGGSSGRLRWELGIPPPGDIRSCLLSMADTESLMEKLFQHRFAAGSGLEGHSFGNLFIAAMTEMFGFQEAVKLFGEVLAIRGRVFPVTLEMVQLEAEDINGKKTQGQSVLYSKEGPLKKISLVPEDVTPLPEALAAISAADAVILGPGSLFTSIIPNLLVPGIVEALLNTPAQIFYVCNVMTQPGETTGFTAADHVKALLSHSNPGLLDYIIVNSDLSVAAENQKPFLEKGSILVSPDYHRLRSLAPGLISGSFISHGAPTRHHGPRVAQVIIEQTLDSMRRSKGGSTFDGRIYDLKSRIRRRLRSEE